MEHFLGSQVSWGTDPQFLAVSRSGDAHVLQVPTSLALSSLHPLNGLLFAQVMLTVPPIEGGGAGTKGAQHASPPIQTAGLV